MDDVVDWTDTFRWKLDVQQLGTPLVLTLVPERAMFQMKASQDTTQRADMGWLTSNTG